MSTEVSPFWLARTLTPPLFFAGVALASAALLGAALYFQYFENLPPCELCIYQRIPYFAAIPLALIGSVFFARRPAAPGGLAVWLAVICGAGFLAGAGVAAFHVGVEQGWWQGTESCVGADLGDLTLAEMRDAILNAPAVRCDEIQWSLLGISMAGWNFLVSLGLVAGTAIAARQWMRAKQP